MKVIAAMLFLTLTGCSTLSKPETFAACQAADAVTTIAAINHGAVETNPIVAWAIKHAGYAGMIGLKVALVAAVYYWLDDIHPDVIAVGSAITCGIAIHNIGVWQSLK